MVHGIDLSPAFAELHRRRRDLLLVIFQGIAQEFAQLVVEFLSLREDELMLLVGDDRDLGMDLPSLDLEIADMAEIDGEILHPEGGIEGRDLKIEGSIGQLDNPAGGDEPAHEIYRFLHENCLFRRNLQHKIDPLVFPP